MAHDDPVASGDEDKERRFGEVVSWAVDHLADETNFGVALVVAGDPEVLAVDLPGIAQPLGDDMLRIVETPSGRAIAVGRRGDGDGPWSIITRSSDGPLDRATIQPDVWTDEASREVIGELVLPSGRLVIGDPEAVGIWGPAVAPENELDVQAMTGWDEPTPTYLGLIVVARLAPGARCRLEVARTRQGQLHTVTIVFPPPDWLPAVMCP